jgi:hypothetical protein
MGEEDEFKFCLKEEVIEKKLIFKDEFPDCSPILSIDDISSETKILEKFDDSLIQLQYESQESKSSSEYNLDNISLNYIKTREEMNMEKNKEFETLFNKKQFINPKNENENIIIDNYMIKNQLEDESISKVENTSFIEENLSPKRNIKSINKELTKEINLKIDETNNLPKSLNGSLFESQLSLNDEISNKENNKSKFEINFTPLNSSSIEINEKIKNQKSKFNKLEILKEPNSNIFYETILHKNNLNKSDMNVSIEDDDFNESIGDWI